MLSLQEIHAPNSVLLTITPLQSISQLHQQFPLISVICPHHIGMTDCYLALPENLIIQTEALAANHSNYRNDGALALEFVLGERRKGRQQQQIFFFLLLSRHE